MAEKRFVDNGFEAIEDQSFTDTKTNKTYYVDYFDEIVDLANQLNDESEQLKKSLANKMDSDAWWEKKAKQRVEELEKENEQLKKQLENMLALYELEEIIE